MLYNNNWTHLRQIAAFHPTPATYRGITATFQAYKQDVTMLTSMFTWTHPDSDFTTPYTRSESASIQKAGSYKNSCTSAYCHWFQAALHIEWCCIRIMHRDDLDNIQTGVYVLNKQPSGLNAYISQHKSIIKKVRYECFLHPFKRILCQVTIRETHKSCIAQNWWYSERRRGYSRRR